MGEKRFIPLLFAVTIFFENGFSQEKMVTGTVAEAETGVPLPGVTVLEKSTNNGVATDWDHTVEPSNVSMNFVDGYTGTEGSVNYEYPDNHLYMDGTVKNDHLTKVITQIYCSGSLVAT